MRKRDRKENRNCQGAGGGRGGGYATPPGRGTRHDVRGKLNTLRNGRTEVVKS